MLFRENIEAMTAYVPGKQPRAGGRFIKLNTNENPYPPSPAVAEAIAAVPAEALRLYPDAMASVFRDTVAGVLDVPPEWVVPGDGSDDVIMMIARACLGPGRAVAYPTPTFTFYETQGLIENAEIVEVPFPADYRLPVDALAAADAAVTFVANPNSPSGTAASNDELDALAGRLSGLLVIDEAYVDFADDSALTLVGKHDNVIVLRTLSKGYSLAGLRVGFGLAKPGIVEGLLKAKSIYNVGAIPAAAAAAAFADQAWKQANAEKVKASRAELTRRLEAMGCSVLPSQANFVLATIPDHRAAEAHKRLEAAGIYVRYYSSPPLEDKLRITIGDEEQNAALVAALQEML